MATVSCQVSKETFVPEKNYFKCENVTVSREETNEEIELWNEACTWSNRGLVILCSGVIFGFIFLILFGCLGNSISPLFYWVCGVGGMFAVAGILLPNIYFWPKEHKLLEVQRAWYRQHEDELWAEARKEVDAYNKEQHNMAATWRSEHPFEEKIRACLLDPKSSVEVANLARYYAEEYLKGFVNESN